MKTLTQVWLICATSCFFMLILGFQLGGRIGLFLAFLLCLIFLYMVFHRGLNLFIKKTRAKEVKGKDIYKFHPQLQVLALNYGFKNIRLFITEQNTPPLVWPEFSNQLIIFINEVTLQSFNEPEKRIFAHLLLSHGATQSRLLRKILGLAYLSLSPLHPFFAPFFNLLGYSLGLSKEIYKADLKALSASKVSQFEFGLLLHKLHYLHHHKDKVFEGTYFFSILSKVQPRLYNLKFHPSVSRREKNILGYSI